MVLGVDVGKISTSANKTKNRLLQRNIAFKPLQHIGLEKMNKQIKQDLIQSWGFEHHIAGIYYRNIYADQGYTEQWTEADPDRIKFIKGGHITEQYKIDWDLFIK